MSLVSELCPYNGRFNLDIPCISDNTLHRIQSLKVEIPQDILDGPKIVKMAREQMPRFEIELEIKQRQVTKLDTEYKEFQAKSCKAKTIALLALAAVIAVVALCVILGTFAVLSSAALQCIAWPLLIAINVISVTYTKNILDRPNWCMKGFCERMMHVLFGTFIAVHNAFQTSNLGQRITQEKRVIAQTSQQIEEGRKILEQYVQKVIDFIKQNNQIVDTIDYTIRKLQIKTESLNAGDDEARERSEVLERLRLTALPGTTPQEDQIKQAILHDRAIFVREINSNIEGFQKARSELTDLQQRIHDAEQRLAPVNNNILES